MGDALLQKEYTVDFLTKKKQRNYGELPQYYVENDHEPIVSREVFQQVQGEFLRRSNKVENGISNGYSSCYALSGKLICSKCGSTYRRMKAHGTNKHTMWRCKKRLMKGAPCDGRNVREEEVQAAVLKALTKLAQNKDSFIQRRDKITTKLLPECSRSLESLENRIEEIRESISQDTTNPDYQEITAILAINQELDRIRAKKAELREKMSSLSLEEFGLSKVLEYLDMADKSDVFTYDDSALLPIIDRVLVLDKGFEVSFIVGKAYKI